MRTSTFLCRYGFIRFHFIRDVINKIIVINISLVYPWRYWEDKAIAFYMEELEEFSVW